MTGAAYGDPAFRRWLLVAHDVDEGLDCLGRVLAGKLGDGHDRLGPARGNPQSDRAFTWGRERWPDQFKRHRLRPVLAEHWAAIHGPSE